MGGLSSADMIALGEAIEEIPLKDLKGNNGDKQRMRSAPNELGTKKR